MNRDHALFLLIGLLAGFLGGYVAHEMMAETQPARIAPGAAAAAPHPPADGESGAPPAMAEINRLRAVVESDPGNREALLALANMNFDIGGWARAQELYERYLELDPDNPDVLTDLGIAVRSQGEPARALELFRRAQSLRPGHWQSIFNEVVVLAFDLRDFATADSKLLELRRLSPGNPDVDRLAQEVQRLQSGG